MRRGFSLLEMIVVAAMMATVVTAVAVLLRSSQAAWAGVDTDQARIDAAHATLRHLVRHLRQAKAISAITSASDTSGSISATMADDSTGTWSLSAGDVQFDRGGGNELLAAGIAELSFTAYEFDSTTATTDVDRIQSVDCTVKVQLTRETNNERTITSRAWLRAW